MGEWEDLISVLARPTTAETMQEAAQRAQAYFMTRPHSRIYFCTLLRYPRAVPLSQMSQRLATDRNFYELFRKIALKRR